MAKRRQERTLSPFTRTVHAPQIPCSQPTCVPVSPNSFRRKSERRRRGSTSAECPTPLTVNLRPTRLGIVHRPGAFPSSIYCALRNRADNVPSVLGRSVQIGVGFGSGTDCLNNILNVDVGERLSS